MGDNIIIFNSKVISEMTFLTKRPPTPVVTGLDLTISHKGISILELLRCHDMSLRVPSFQQLQNMYYTVIIHNLGKKTPPFNILYYYYYY